MQPPRRAELWARILLPLLLIPLLGIAARPHAVVIAFRQARTALDNQRTLEAGLYLAEAAQHHPWRADLWETAAWYLLENGSPGTAIYFLDQSQTQNPLAFRGTLTLGSAYLELGDLPGAVEVWENALTQNGSSPAIYEQLAQVHLLQEDYAAALLDLQTLIQLDPYNPQYQYTLGLTLAATDPEAALPPLAQAAALDESLADAVHTLILNIENSLLEEDPAYTYVSAGQALGALEEWPLAVEAFRRAAELEPEYAAAWAFLGEAYFHIGRDGLPELEKALALYPYSLAGNIFQALYYQRQERHEYALIYFHTAALLDPGNPALQVEIGGTLAQMSDLPTAMKYYQRAVELAPHDTDYWIILASFSINNQYLIKTIGLPAARQAVILAPDNPATLTLMGQAFLVLEDDFSARRFLRRALAADPNYAPAHLYLGIMYLAQGKRTEAWQQLSLAQSLSPESPSAHQAQRILQRYFP